MRLSIKWRLALVSAALSLLPSVVMSGEKLNGVLLLDYQQNLRVGMYA